MTGMPPAWPPIPSPRPRCGSRCRGRCWGMSGLPPGWRRGLCRRAATGGHPGRAGGGCRGRAGCRALALNSIGAGSRGWSRRAARRWRRSSSCPRRGGAVRAAGPARPPAAGPATRQRRRGFRRWRRLPRGRGGDPRVSERPGLGWTVLLRVRPPRRCATCGRCNGTSCSSGLAAAAVAAALGWLAAAWLAGPLRRLAAAATRLQRDGGAGPLPSSARAVD